jgi:hypothetical protein
MRLKLPKLGETRNIKKFAFLPIKAKNLNIDRYEIRWFCFVFIHQRYAHEWLNEYFIDK